MEERVWGALVFQLQLVSNETYNNICYYIAITNEVMSEDGVSINKNKVGFSTFTVQFKALLLNYMLFIVARLGNSVM